MNATDKIILKGGKELISKLVSNETTNIVMLVSSSKDLFIKFADQCLHILNSKEILDGLKCSTKIQEIESLSKYQPHV